jgi:hypothetical protein
MLNNAGGSEVKLPQDPDLLPPSYCVRCHKPIRSKDRAFALAFGHEDARKDLGSCLFFTGMVWHKQCLDHMALPGMEGRDDPLEEDGRGRRNAGS